MKTVFPYADNLESNQAPVLAIRIFHRWVAEHSNEFDSTIIPVGDGLPFAIKR